MSEISIKQLTDALLDESKVFPARYLHRLSDLTSEDAGAIKNIWPKITPTPAHCFVRRPGTAWHRR